MNGNGSLHDENEAVKERYELSMERIRGILEEETVNPIYSDYFHRVTDFLLLLDYVRELLQKEETKEYSLGTLRLLNEKLYEDVIEGNYPESYANPSYATLIFGEEYGPLLSVLYKELRGLIRSVYAQKDFNVVIACELFLQIYGYFLDEENPSIEALRDVLYWYFSDYMDRLLPQFLDDLYLSIDSNQQRHLMAADFMDERALYAYGMYITREERKLFSYMKEFSVDELHEYAVSYVDEIQEVIGKKQGEEHRQRIRFSYPIGTELLAREIVKELKQRKIEIILNGESLHIPNEEEGRNGAYATSYNAQYGHDHEYDFGMILDKAFAERREGLYRQWFESKKDILADYCGFAGILYEQSDTITVKKTPEAFRYSEKQWTVIEAINEVIYELKKEYLVHDQGEIVHFVVAQLPD